MLPQLVSSCVRAAVSGMGTAVRIACLIQTNVPRTRAEWRSAFLPCPLFGSWGIVMRRLLILYAFVFGLVSAATATIIATSSRSQISIDDTSR